MNIKPKNLNALNASKDSKRIKTIFLNLELKYDEFNKDLIAKLCKNQMGKKVDIDSIVKKDIKKTKFIDSDEFIKDDDVKSVEELLAKIGKDIYLSLEDNNIEKNQIVSIYHDPDSGLEVIYNVEESEKSYEIRIKNAKKQNLLISNYDRIIEEAKRLYEENKVSKNTLELDKINKAIKELEEKKLQLQLES